MGCSNGPVRTLPGHKHKLPAGYYCVHEDHQGRDAVAKIQGETDSFGCEFIYMCQECYDDFQSSGDSMAIGVCDWCGIDSINRAPTRDIDEGSSGPVYYVCRACVIMQNNEMQKELDASV